MALNIAQFCTTLNDNLFKLLLVFFLIALQGSGHSYTILALAGFIFVIPFIVLAATAGTLADRYSKTQIIKITRWMEIGTALMGLLAFLIESSFLAYTTLFLFSVESALFSPCKYGIIPEIVPPERISYYNGWISATTYLAIIVGTFFASLLVQITHAQYPLATLSTVFVSLIGWIASLGIPNTPPQAPGKSISFRIFGEIYRTIQRARAQRYLAHALVFGAYFLFMAAYTQLNIIPFTLDSLGLPETRGGYIFLITSLGIGIGSYLAGKISSWDTEIGIVPLALLCSGFCFIALAAGQHHWIVVAPSLLLLGFFGGFYIVPIDIFIQVTSPDKDRGQNVSAANFLSFAGVVGSSIYLSLMGNTLGVSAATGFLAMGILTLGISALLILWFFDQVVRLCAATFLFLFCDMQIVGKRRISRHAPLVIVGQRRSWMDVILLMATLPRHVRVIVPIHEETKRHPLYYRLFKFIPLDTSAYTPIGVAALEEIQNELTLGHSVCILHPAQGEDLPLKAWREHVESWLQDVNMKALPVYLSHEEIDPLLPRWKQCLSLLGTKIKVGFGLPIDNS